MFKFIEKMVEFIGWLQLFVFPIVFFCVLGGILYYYNPFGFGLILFILSIVSGLVVGIWYANRVHKKEGTVNHLSTILRMPELEQKDSKENEEK